MITAHFPLHTQLSFLCLKTNSYSEESEVRGNLSEQGRKGLIRGLGHIIEVEVSDLDSGFCYWQVCARSLCS